MSSERANLTVTECTGIVEFDTINGHRWMFHDINLSLMRISNSRTMFVYIYGVFTYVMLLLPPLLVSLLDDDGGVGE